jgi:hypothetical protein
MTDTIVRLDVPDLLNLLDTIVDEAPDQESTTRYCVYRTSEAKNYGSIRINEDSPANCIAGETIYRLGGLEALEALEEKRIIARNPDLIDDEDSNIQDNPARDSESEDPVWLRAYSVAPGIEHNRRIAEKFLTPEAVQVLRVAQFSQDEGKTWGASVDRAKQYAAEKGGTE